MDEPKEIVYLDALSMGSEAKQLNTLLADHDLDVMEESDKEDEKEDLQLSRGRVRLIYETIMKSELTWTNEALNSFALLIVHCCSGSEEFKTKIKAKAKFVKANNNRERYIICLCFSIFYTDLGADELAARSKQALLYRLLNATRIQPWLVILIVNRQVDFNDS